MNLVISFDVSSRRTGIAVLDTEGKLIDYAAFESHPDAKTGANLERFRTTVRSWLAGYLPAFVVIERQPVLRNISATNKIAAFRGIVYLVAEGLHDLTVSEVSPHQRFTALGVHRPTKKDLPNLTASQRRKVTKQVIIDEVNKRFSTHLTPKQDDEADAIAIALQVYNEYAESKIQEG